MTDFLLELRSEEIPARMQAGARASLEKLFREQMAAAGVAHGALTVWSTPRRLALIARDLPLATQAVTEEAKGPRTSAPEQALEGFLRKTGLTKDQLTDRDGVWFAVTQKPGRATSEVLAEAIPAIIRAFPWPKSQRWGAASISTESLRWVRPLSGIVALLGDDLVECEVGGIHSGYATKGHRFHHPGASQEKVGTGFSARDATTNDSAITIGSAHDYAEKLRACHVIVNHEDREALIREQAKAAAANAGLKLVEDEGLVIENAGLTEWPVPLLGRFDSAYLDVPPEVIQLTARTNQKYFVCEDSAGKLANAFICTANITAHDGGEGIIAGNRKVLAARLSDARFFWEQDRKTKLSDHAQKLSRITFHEKLGTIADKVDRIAKLARWLIEEGIVKSSPSSLGEGDRSPQASGGGADRGTLADMAEQAARLCKADLVTEMVGEFPELQGLMGGYYARAEGLPDAVADAIRDHYKPVGQGDDVPTAPVTVAVALADRIDSLVGFFAIDQKPTGSKDPFALRRSALGTISLISNNQLRLGLEQLLFKSGVSVLADVTGQQEWDKAKSIAQALDDAGIQEFDEYTKVYQDDVLTPRLPELSLQNLSLMKQTYGELLAFFADRLKVQQKEAGVRHDLIDAVFALGGEDDLVRLLARVHALQSFITTEDGQNLHAGYKRAANILKAETKTGWDAQATNPAPEPTEAALIAALQTAEPRATAAVAAEDFAAAMTALSTLRAPIDAFFTDVTVNDPDPAKRAARLALLDRFRVAVHKVADFSKIEG